MTRPRMVTDSGQAWMIAVLAGIALLAQVACAQAAWAEPPARVTRQEIEAFEQSLQPLIQEGRAIQEELGELQRTLREERSQRKDLDAPEQVRQDLEMFRTVNRHLSRLERLVVSAESLRPSAGLEAPFVALLLAMQNTVAMVRNLQLWKLTHQQIYRQAATAHHTQALAARASYATRMQELKREAAR